MRREINQKYELQDNLKLESGRVFLTGTQALVRMLLSQARRDKARGLNTAGFVSGYRGSPLGGVDAMLWRHQKELQAAHIHFQPAINEDLAATMLMGTQQLDNYPNKEVDGVFGMWYGKGPGVDRSGDALLHGHAAGASSLGGVLVVVGDDHAGVSSSIPHGSEQVLRHLRMPIVHPTSVEEYEYFGLWGWALSRYSGAWVAFKAITETVESGRSFVLPSVPDFDLSHTPSKYARSYDARPFLTPQIEHNIESRLRAVQEFVRAYPLDRYLTAAPEARFGIVSSGKSTLDVVQALDTLSEHCKGALPPIRHYKVGLIWPLDAQGIQEFAQGLEHILVVEEKGDFLEGQIKNVLYGASSRPTVSGKQGRQQEQLIPSTGQLSPTIVRQAIVQWLSHNHVDLGAHADAAQVVTAAPMPHSFGLTRRPYFCSGCPHSTSTRVPDGSRALAGVGCHYMAAWMDRNTQGLTQMGGEGVDWIGASAFMQGAHVFQNMGEGTYFHSGYLAIRQAVAAQANITYKILFNDAVAMTGGQPVDGPISVPRICQQVLGEGVAKVVVTTDEPERYKTIRLPAGVAVYHRRELDYVQRQLRETPGVTVLIHDQTCAAEKRRRRKKKQYPEPVRRIYIHPEVCEGCGDCGVQSNCLSIVPLETELGRKRAVDQSSCNQDYSCVEGFCPSFVSVLNAAPRKAAGLEVRVLHEQLEAVLQQAPTPNPIAAQCNLLVAGIGGTGVVTIGAIVAMAAHLENRAASVLDSTGLAQKGGTVISHVRFSAGEHLNQPVRIDEQQADVAIWCDTVAATHPEAARRVRAGHTQVFINSYLAPTAEFTAQPDVVMPRQALVEQLRTQVGAEHSYIVDAYELAERLLGDSILANMLMLGVAWQAQAIPLQLESIYRAIELNGVAVEANKLAFQVGRVWAYDPDALRTLMAQGEAVTQQAVARPQTVYAALQLYVPRLIAYQNKAYAQRFQSVIEELYQAEQRVAPTQYSLTVHAAHSLYRLMAYKDEYEVARLLSDPAFMKSLTAQFEPGLTLNFHLAPPIGKRLGSDGRPQKRRFGPWAVRFMSVLARAKVVRGTPFDIFGYQAERKMERALRDEFIAQLKHIATHLNKDNYEYYLQLVRLPQEIRGFGPVKEAAVARYRERVQAVQAQYKKELQDVKNI